MKKNKVVILIVISFTVIVLVGAWFYLQHVMEKYDIDKKDWSGTTYSLHEEPASSPLFDNFHV